MRRLLAGVVVASFALAGCSSGADSTGDAPAGEATVVTVSAASSLTDAFTAIGDAYSAAHPGTELRFNFAGSSTLAEQIIAGAPVDVFAAASPLAMQKAVDGGSMSDPTIFTENSLAIAVPAGNPSNVSSLADLAREDVTVVVCAEAVPCGAATAELFARNGLDVTPASLEPDVRAVLTKVAVDEADAGVVYRTDVAAAGADVEGIDIPDDMNVVNEYLIATTAGAPSAAQGFVEYVLSDQGQTILARWGFTPR